MEGKETISLIYTQAHQNAPMPPHTTAQLYPQNWTQVLNMLDIWSSMLLCHFVFKTKTILYGKQIYSRKHCRSHCFLPEECKSETAVTKTCLKPSQRDWLVNPMLLKLGQKLDPTKHQQLLPHARSLQLFQSQQRVVFAHGVCPKNYTYLSWSSSDLQRMKKPVCTDITWLW